MALPPTDPNEAFIREVDDAVRQDAIFGFWTRWGKAVAGVVVGGLVLFAGYLGFGAYQNSQAEKTSELFAQLLEDAQKPAPLKAESIAAVRDGGASGYDAAATLMEAADAVKANRNADAIRIYGELAANGSAPQPVRDLAVVRQTALQFDTLSPQQVIDRLKPYAAPGNPWFGSAGELVALAHVKMNKPDAAGPLFAAIAKDKTVPPSIRTRAVQMAGLLGVDAVIEEN